MAKMSDEKLATILEKAISQSEHITDGQLSKERSEIDSYYRGELPKPMHSGDSKYVSRDVYDSVDSMRADVLESFSAHSRVVMFRPERGETVDDAKQATEYCRHVFFKVNKGEDILYDVMTDGLMKRFSVVKVYFDETTEEKEYEFEALTADELTAAVMEHEEFEFKDTGIDDNGLYSGTYVVPEGSKRVVVEVIQPEDILVSSRTCDLVEAKYIIHRITKTKSNLKKMGIEKSKIDEINWDAGSDFEMDYEKQQRFEMVDDVISDSNSLQEASKSTTIYECYIHLDMDGTGVTKLYKVLYAKAGVVLEEPEQVSRMPFAAFVPLPIPHVFHGENFAKGVIPIQNARTVLFRQIINHSLVTNNPRHQVLNGTIQSPKELMDNRMGGVVNVRRMDGIAPIPQAPLNPFVFNLISMLDEDKEEVTGVSKLSQGMNKDAISTQNAEGMVEQLISQSQKRQKIVARRFASFLKELYLLIYATAMDHMGEDEFVSATGEYVPVDTSAWKERSVASVELTLGYGEEQQEAMKWMEIDAYLTNDPVLVSGYGYDKKFEVISRALEKRGVEDIEAFLTPPDQMEPPEPSQAEILQMEQLQSQITLTTAQAQSMVAKSETDRMKAEADLLKVQLEAKDREREYALSVREFAHDVQQDREEMALAKQAEDQKAVFHPE